MQTLCACPALRVQKLAAIGTLFYQKWKLSEIKKPLTPIVLGWKILEPTFFKMSLVMRKPVFGVCDQVRLKPACTASETGWNLEILDLERRGIILSRQRTTKALIKLCGCAGWSAPLLFAHGKSRFSHDEAQICFLLFTDPESVARDFFCFMAKNTLFSFYGKRVKKNHQKWQKNKFGSGVKMVGWSGR